MSHSITLGRSLIAAHSGRRGPCQVDQRNILKLCLFGLAMIADSASTNSTSQDHSSLLPKRQVYLTMEFYERELRANCCDAKSATLRAHMKNFRGYGRDHLTPTSRGCEDLQDEIRDIITTEAVIVSSGALYGRCLSCRFYHSTRD
jgi:hypothetical protein